MKIIVIGLGSMGKRRIKLIKKIEPQAEIIGLDSRSDRRFDAEESFDIKTYSSLNEVFDKNIKIAFICTSPLSHYELIKECLSREYDVFTEINLHNEWYDEIIEIAKKHDRIVYISSTQQFKNEIKKVGQIIGESVKNNYIYHVGQYLPDWHPWEKYNEYFYATCRRY